MTITRGKLFYFINQSHLESTNSLLQFINFLKFSDQSSCRNFSFSDGENTLHSHLSFKENLLLESVSQTLTKTVEENINDQISNTNNSKLNVLLHNYLKFEHKVSQFNEPDKQILSILKAVVKNSNYIFLNKPDTNLNLLQIKTIKTIIHSELYKGRHVYLISDNQEFWIDFVDIFVEENNFQYSLKNNELIFKLA